MKGRHIRPFDISLIAILAIFIFVMVRVSYVYPNPIVESSRDMDWEEGALKIQSDEMVLKTREQKIHFKGHVIVRHQEMVLKADHVVLFLKEKKNEAARDFSILDSQAAQQIERIEAEGNIKFEGGLHRGESDRAEYFQEKGVVVLTGNPEVWEGDSHLVGSKITILLKQKKSIVEEGRVILHPQ